MKKYSGFLLMFALALLFPLSATAAGQRDLHHNITASIAIPVTTSTDNTAVVGNIIDTREYGGIEFVLFSGTITDNTDTLTALVEDGDDSALSDAVAVSDANLFGTEALASFVGTEDDSVKFIGYKGTKRYVRLTVTPAIATSAVFGAVVVQGHPKVVPTR